MNYLDNFATIKAIASTGAKYKDIAKKLADLGYTNTVGKPITTQDVSYALRSMGIRRYGSKTVRHRRSPIIGNTTVHAAPTIDNTFTVKDIAAICTSLDGTLAQKLLKVIVKGA